MNEKKIEDILNDLKIVATPGAPGRLKIEGIDNALTEIKQVFRDMIMKNLCPPEIDDKVSKDDCCFVCGSPLNKGEWEKYINKIIEEAL